MLLTVRSVLMRNIVIGKKSVGYRRQDMNVGTVGRKE